MCLKLLHLFLLALITSTFSQGQQEQTYCHEYKEKCILCMADKQCFCVSNQRWITLPCVQNNESSFFQTIHPNGTIICPSEYLTEKEVTRYPNGGTKKLFCHCSIKQEDIAPFKTCSVKFKTAPIIIPTCPPQVTCPAHNQNIVPKQDSLIGTQQHQDILCLIWAVVGLLIAMAVAQLLAIVLIVRLTVKKQVFNHDVIALTDSPSKRDDEEGVIIENDIYGTL